MGKKYDYLIVGAGLFGSVFAHEATKKGLKCLVIDRRNHIGGNTYCESVLGINVHKYGAHIFHTSDKEVWEYINQFCEFNNFILNVMANYNGEMYNLPFNMNTFSKLWNISTPDEAKKIIDEQKKTIVGEPKNYEEQAISLVGTDIYSKLIKEYTEKQWGRSCKELPSFIIKRLPVRYTYNNNYYYDRYQGIPIGGYNPIIEKMLKGSDVKLNYDYLEHKEELNNIADKVLYTGMIDEYYGYKYGKLEYRTLDFETEVLENIDNFQGTAVVSYPTKNVKFTRIIEHKHFEMLETPGTVITKEYSKNWVEGDEAYYPINDDKNTELYNKYKELANNDGNVIFGGRLGNYQYYDMDKTIRAALNLVSEVL